MCTGGGHALNGSRRGSMTLAPSFPVNQSRPSAAFAIYGPMPDGHDSLCTPSAASNTVAATDVVRPLAHATISWWVTRTRPHAMLAHSEPASSKVTQLTASHGRPFLRLRVITRPS